MDFNNLVNGLKSTLDKDGDGKIDFDVESTAKQILEKTSKLSKEDITDFISKAKSNGDISQYKEYLSEDTINKIFSLFK